MREDLQCAETMTQGDCGVGRDRALCNERKKDDMAEAAVVQRASDETYLWVLASARKSWFSYHRLPPIMLHPSS